MNTSQTDEALPNQLPLSGEPNRFVFVHSYLDDYGLPPAAFRVYCHLARRAGHRGAWPAVKSIARVCRLHPQTVRKALRLLMAHYLLRGEPRRGETTIYHLMHPSTWQPPTRMDDGPLEIETPLSEVQESTAKGNQAPPSETDIAKGNPLEGNQRKVIHISPVSFNGEKLKFTDLHAPQVEEIYAAYPRRVGKPAALRAIRRALRAHPADFLLKQTQLFARTYNGEPQFIPFPSTWFSQERFNDDPATWRRTAATIGKLPPAIIRPDNFGCGLSKL
jgi:hypothetical protein